MLKNLKLILWLILLSFMCVGIGLGEEPLPPPTYEVKKASPEDQVKPEKEYVISSLKLTEPVIVTPLEKE